MDEENLKSCPFCGCWPTAGYVGDADGGYWAIECPKCNGTTNADGRFVGVHSDSREAARAAWNKRPD